jgi:molybdopterin converting factor small subunit
MEASAANLSMTQTAVADNAENLSNGSSGAHREPTHSERRNIVKIRIVVAGRGYDAEHRLPPELDLPAGSTIQNALERLGGGVDLPTTCLVIVSGVHVGTLGGFTDQPLKEGDEVLLLAPVAGGAH